MGAGERWSAAFGWLPAGRRERRRLIVVLVIVVVAVAGWVGVRRAWTAYTQAPIMYQLTQGAMALQRSALGVRTDAPAATGPVAERSLAAALGMVDRARVLGTATGPDGQVRADVSLWAEIETAEFSFDDPKQAEVCLHVIAVPGAADGGYGARGSVALEPFDCPPGVELASMPHESPPPPSLPELPVELPAQDVPPVYKPCYSGSNRCI